MDVELTRGLGDVQVVVEELAYRRQGFFVKLGKDIVVKGFTEEELAERVRKLENEPSDTEIAVGDYMKVRVEDTSYVDGKLRLLIRLGQMIEQIGWETVGNPYRDHCFGVEHVGERVSSFCGSLLAVDF